MSYSKLTFDGNKNLVAFKTQFSSSFQSNYLLIPQSPDPNTTYIPIYIIAHYDTLTGTFGSEPRYNLGTDAPNYQNITLSGTLSAQSRVTNCISNLFDVQGTYPTGSLYFRYWSNITTGTITGSIYVLALEVRS